MLSHYYRLWTEEVPDASTYEGHVQLVMGRKLTSNKHNSVTDSRETCLPSYTLVYESIILVASPTLFRLREALNVIKCLSNFLTYQLIENMIY